MRILIIDDDAVCRKLMASALRRTGAITEATDGKLAMAAVRDALLAKTPFNLITLDIMMPDMDGHSVLMAIRSMEAVAGIPVGKGSPIIMTSALNDGRNVLGAFREMANGYLTKPIDLAKLHAACRELGLEP
jgi:two-component system chemotaxis response regulator CheY